MSVYPLRNQKGGTMKVLVIYHYSRTKLEPTHQDGKMIEVKHSSEILTKFMHSILRERYTFVEVTAYLTESGEQHF